MAPMVSIDEALASNRARRSIPGPAALTLIRTKAGVTKAAVARALGVEVSTVLRWESGATRPSAAIAPAYAELIERLAAEAGLTALLEAEAVDGRGRT